MRILTLSKKLALFIKSVTRGESSVIFVVFSLHFSPNRIRYAKLDYRSRHVIQSSPSKSHGLLAKTIDIKQAIFI